MSTKKEALMSQKIVIVGTGGTIAGLSLEPGAGGAYRAAQVGVASLVEQACEPMQTGYSENRVSAADPFPWEATSGAPHVELVSEQLAQVDSKDMTETIWQRLLVRLEQLQQDPSVMGVVITHGTDTLEETGFLLHACWPRGKPVVLTCAMRASDAPNADGPGNLRDAIVLARTPGLQGVLMVCDGQVFEGHVFQKSRTEGVQPFEAHPLPPLGLCRPAPFVPQREVDHQRAYAPLTDRELSTVLACRHWPRVEIVFNHAGADGQGVQALLTMSTPLPARVRGFVLAGTGQGTYSERLGLALRQAVQQGVRVWRSTRAAWGSVHSTPVDEFRGVPWPPVKARVALMLDLITGRC